MSHANCDGYSDEVELVDLKGGSNSCSRQPKKSYVKSANVDQWPLCSFDSPEKAESHYWDSGICDGLNIFARLHNCIICGNASKTWTVFSTLEHV